MQAEIYNLNGEARGKLTLPRAFSEPVREDLIKKAFLAEISRKRQPYGSDPLAGKRTSAHYHGRRGIKHSMMNREMARMKRIHGTGGLHMTARFVPQAVKGRKAHPPKVEKVWEQKINKKERLKALFSSIAATANRDFILKRGHRIEGVKQIPLIMEDEVQNIKKTRDLLVLLEKFGFGEELERCEERKVRSGKGKTRGRKYKIKKGPLLVVDIDDNLKKASKNIPGMEIARTKDLTVEMLAPGAQPGRLAIWTKSAIENLNNIGVL